MTKRSAPDVKFGLKSAPEMGFVSDVEAVVALLKKDEHLKASGVFDEEGPPSDNDDPEITHVDSFTVPDEDNYEMLLEKTMSLTPQQIETLSMDEQEQVLQIQKAMTNLKKINHVPSSSTTTTTTATTTTASSSSSSSSFTDTDPSPSSCPVCFEIMKAPLQIFLCEKGHSLCSACKSKVKECPTCRMKMTQMRNFSLEDLIAKNENSNNNKNEDGIQNISSILSRQMTKATPLLPPPPSVTCPICSVKIPKRDIVDIQNHFTVTHARVLHSFPMPNASLMRYPDEKTFSFKPLANQEQIDVMLAKKSVPSIQPYLHLGIISLEWFTIYHERDELFMAIGTWWKESCIYVHLSYIKNDGKIIPSDRKVTIKLFMPKKKERKFMRGFTWIGNILTRENSSGAYNAITLLKYPSFIIPESQWREIEPVEMKVVIG